jgi:hypothetical protein
MANTRIDPFRDYSEHDVINMFALDWANLTRLNDDDDDKVAAILADMKNLSDRQGQWESGVCVKVKAGAKLPGDIPGGFDTSGDLRTYLGHSHTNAHIGYNNMPYNNMLLSVATAVTGVLGITLRPTLAYDENGENLMRYPVKKDELQCVGPGETVPVLTRGTVLLTKAAFASNTLPVVGQQLNPTIAANNTGAAGKNDKWDLGKLVGSTAAVGQGNGLVLALGDGKALCRMAFGK